MSKNKRMQISKYSSFFHDGEILDIKHTKNTIEILMRSAEIDPDEMKDNIRLSLGNFITGKLHIQEIKKIKVNEKPFYGIIKKTHNDNDLLHLKISKNTVFIEIGWRGPLPCQNDFSAFEIEANKIWWENIPNSEYRVF
jgi:hypothetical protein